MLFSFKIIFFLFTLMSPFFCIMHRCLIFLPFCLFPLYAAMQIHSEEKHLVKKAIDVTSELQTSVKAVSHWRLKAN